jgi:hypothetical protein
MNMKRLVLISILMAGAVFGQPEMRGNRGILSDSDRNALYSVMSDTADAVRTWVSGQIRSDINDSLSALTMARLENIVGLDIITGSEYIPEFEDSLSVLLEGPNDTTKLVFTNNIWSTGDCNGIKLQRMYRDKTVGISFYTGNDLEWNMGSDFESSNPVLCFLPGIGDIVRLNADNGKMVIGPGVGDPEALSYQLSIEVGDSVRKGFGVTTSTTNAIEGISTSGYGLKGTSSSSYGGYFSSSGTHGLYVSGIDGKGIYSTGGLNIGGTVGESMLNDKIRITFSAADSADFISLLRSSANDFGWINFANLDSRRDWRVGQYGVNHSLVFFAGDGAATDEESPGTRRFTFTEDGYIGIGTSYEPTKALDVAGDALFVSTVSNTVGKSNAWLGLQSVGTSDHFWGFRLNTSGGLCFDSFYGGNPYERVNFERGGYVGIGKDPDEKLDVDGNIKLSGDLDVDGNDIDIGDAGGFSGIKFDPATTQLQFFIDGTQVGHIGTDGAYVDDVP